MAVNTNAFTKAKQFRLPHDVCARLEQQESQTAFLVEALRAAFKRLDMQQAKAAKKQEGAEYGPESRTPRNSWSCPGHGSSIDLMRQHHEQSDRNTQQDRTTSRTAGSTGRHAP